MIPAHAIGYNRNSIGICYEGGLNGDSVPTDTRTPEQKEAILRLLHELLLRFPGCRICGHRDLANKACPCFDAEKEYNEL
jgi:N-acetylmuramoyl-L-alanine amidase